MKKFALDIFKLLKKIDDPAVGDIYASLSDEEKKGFAPIVVTRWLSGTTDEQQLMLLNEFVNPYIFSLAKHPHLLMQLMQAASSKTSKRYSWLAQSKNSKNQEIRNVVMEFYGMSARELETLNPFPSPADVMSMAESLGYQKDKLTKLQAELKGK